MAGDDGGVRFHGVDISARDDPVADDEARGALEAQGVGQRPHVVQLLDDGRILRLGDGGLIVNAGRFEGALDGGVDGFLARRSGTFRRNLRAAEHAGDDTTHAVFHQLNSSFITPFDREDIYRLASSLDDVMDFMEEAVDLTVLYAGGSVDASCFVSGGDNFGGDLFENRMADVALERVGR